MIVGAVAVGAWGRPRATADIDVTVLVDEAGLEQIAREAQVRLTATGVVVDVMRPRDSHEERAIQRRRPLAIDGHRLWFAAPDDLILMKLKAGRPRDFEDAVGVLVAQREALDEGYMADWARRLTIADELAYVLRASE